MKNYIIYIWGREIGEVSGYEKAWNAYRKAKELCEMLSAGCELVDGDTGEVIDSFRYWPEEEEESPSMWDEISSHYDEIG